MLLKNEVAHLLARIEDEALRAELCRHLEREGSLLAPVGRGLLGVLSSTPLVGAPGDCLRNRLCFGGWSAQA